MKFHTEVIFQALFENVNLILKILIFIVKMHIVAQFSESYFKKKFFFFAFFIFFFNKKYIDWRRIITVISFINLLCLQG